MVSTNRSCFRTACTACSAQLWGRYVKTDGVQLSSKALGRAGWHARWFLGLTAAVLLVVCVVNAWHLRFVQDDAFISFRYAANLAAGHGLVFNVGERLEGYTNFLFTLIIAIPEAAGWNAEQFSYFVGMTGWLLALTATGMIVLRALGGSAGFALATCVLVASNYTFRIYATGGLETSMQAGLLVLFLALLADPRSLSEQRSSLPALASVAGAFALLTRLDSAVVVVPAAIVYLLLLFTTSLAWRLKIRRTVSAAIPALLIVGAYLLWKLYYYGGVLPNTYYAKMSEGDGAAVYGMEYLRAFFRSYWVWPGILVVLVVVVSVVWRWLRKDRQELTRSHVFVFLSTVAATAAWCGYVVHAGGDFMEYRFFVVLIPMLSLFVAGVIALCTRSPASRTALLLVLAAAMFLNHRVAGVRPEFVESREQLAGHLDWPQDDWRGIGKRLGELFGEDSAVTIAIGPAGVIPYFSRLRTIDMLGLNDEWVARHGRYEGAFPGHRRKATLEYLLRSGTDLVISHPRLLRREEESPAFHHGPLHACNGFFVPAESYDTLERVVGARIVRMPVNETHDLLMLWLTPDNSDIARVAKEDAWSVVRVERQ